MLQKNNKTLYLHVGSPKTGTTELQRFFFENKEWLSDQGIFYPLCGLHSSDQLRLSWQSNKFISNYKNPLLKTQSTESYWQNIANLDGIENQDILISAEGFYWDFMPDKNNHLAFINNLFPEHSIKIIIYLREQFDFLKSIRNEFIKRGYIDTHVDLHSLEKDIKTNISNGLASYKEWLDNIASIIGRDNLIVKVYEREKLYQKDIVPDFLSTIKIDYQKAFLRGDDDANPRVKSTLLLDLLESLGSKLASINQRSRKQLFQLLINSQLSNVRINNPNPSSEVDDKEPSFDGQLFAKENHYLSETYLSDQQSISPPSHPIIIQPQQFISTDDCAELISKVWVEEQKKLQHILKELCLTLSNQDHFNLEYIPLIESHRNDTDALHTILKILKLRRKLKEGKYQRVALFGYNDISQIITHNMASLNLEPTIIIDKMANDMKTYHSMRIPVNTVEKSDLTNVDAVILCTEHCASSMSNALKNHAYKGEIILYSEE